MEVGPIQQGKGRFSINLNSSKRIYFSPFCTNSSSLEQIAKGESEFVVNYPSWLNAIMVSSTIITHSANTITCTKNSEPFIRSKQRKASLDRVGKLTTPGMESFREKSHAEGVSEKSAAFITNAKRSGTNAHYKSA